MSTIVAPRSQHLGALHRLGVDTRYLLLGLPIGIAIADRLRAYVTQVDC